MYDVTFTPDARGLMSGSLDKTLKRWDVSRLVGGQNGQQASPGASKCDPLNGKNEVGNGSAGTISFTGHNVNLDIEQIGPKLIDWCRTMYSPLPSRTTASGS